MNRLSSNLQVLTAFLVVLAPAFARAEMEQPAFAPLVEEHVSVPAAPALQPAVPNARVSRIQGGPSNRSNRISRLIPPIEESFDEHFEASVRILACESQDKKEKLPKELREAVQSKLISHPACGKLPARELMNEKTPIEIGETKTIDHQKPVSFLLNRAALSAKGGFEQTTTRQDVTGGLRVTLTLRALDGSKAQMELSAQELQVDTTREEQLLFDDGRVFLNPVPMQWERGLQAQGTVNIGKPEVLGGQAYARKPAEAEQEVMPESGRLWAEVTLQPAPQTAKK
ncbi:MAG: hypothetical protein GC134_09925 [Proteobacteria bacterium]|nr:hypothetical protein [Pseudomonadota bacterium]